MVQRLECLPSKSEVAGSNLGPGNLHIGKLIVYSTITN